MPKKPIKSITNMHGDHTASCLCCAMSYIDGGSPGYSEYTPGSPAACECIKGHWSLEYMSINLMQMMHDSARTCKDFIPRMEIKNGQ